ncbi:MAG: NUDIX hydrolase [Eubacterium sp.]|nr:NUDIX hydrolase [Eubacterium sp.]
MHLFEKTIESEVKYDGRILTVCSDTVELENGSTAYRDVIRHSGGVCVVPITDNNEVLMVRQFRYPFGAVLLEIPAGKLNECEDHYECGLRELEEETGCTCTSYQYLGCLYPTPAYCSEITHMYLATGLSDGKQHLDEDEFLEVEKIPLDKAIEMVLNNEIPDAKTQLALMKAKAILDKKTTP